MRVDVCVGVTHTSWTTVTHWVVYASLLYRQYIVALQQQHQQQQQRSSSRSVAAAAAAANAGATAVQQPYSCYSSVSVALGVPAAAACDLVLHVPVDLCTAVVLELYSSRNVLMYRQAGPQLNHDRWEEHGHLHV